MYSLVLKPWRWLTGFFCAAIICRAAAAFSAIAFGVAAAGAETGAIGAVSFAPAGLAMAAGTARWAG